MASLRLASARLLMPMPWLPATWLVPTQHAIAIDFADELLSVLDHGRLNFSRDLLHDFFFDSVVDHRSEPSPRITGISLIEKILPEHRSDKLQEMFFHWRTPAATWEIPEVMPGALEAYFNKSARLSCINYCKQRFNRRGTSCCKPREHCPRLHSHLMHVLELTRNSHAAFRIQFSENFKGVFDDLWPFSLHNLLLPVSSALRIVEDLMFFLSMLWAGYQANPSLQQCLASRWGKAMRDIHLGMVALWRDVRRSQESLYWELVATSRFSVHSWGLIGPQTGVLEAIWQKGANIVWSLYYVLESVKNNLLRDYPKNWLESAKNNLLGDYPTNWQSVFVRHREENNLDPSEDGAYPSLILKRQKFINEWAKRQKFINEWAIDKSILRYLIRHVLKMDQTVADFGAFGGKYSEWLNETGLVTAFAYDGIENVAGLTDGRVQTLDLAKRVDLGRTFDWVFCLEVGELMPKHSEDVLLDNIARHARVGAVISWATPSFSPPHHPNTLTLEESTRAIERHGFVQDVLLTKGLRDASEQEWFKERIGVFHKAT